MSRAIDPFLLVSHGVERSVMSSGSGPGDMDGVRAQPDLGVQLTAFANSSPTEV